MEYGTAAWATASKTNAQEPSKVHNAGLSTILGGIKTTPTQLRTTPSFQYIFNIRYAMNSSWEQYRQWIDIQQSHTDKEQIIQIMD